MRFKSIFCCVLLLTGIVTPAWSAPLFKHQAGSLKINIENTAQIASSDYIIQLNSNKFNGVSVFTLSNPSRIVIDLNGPKIQKNSVHDLLQKSLVNPTTKLSVDLLKQLRLGVHQDKVRLVFDLNSAKIPRYSWTQKPGSVVLKLTQPLNKENRAAATQQKYTAQLQPVNLLAAYRTNATGKSTTGATATEEPIAKNSLLNPASPSIKAVAFDSIGNPAVPVLKISLSQRSDFKLVKSGKLQYRLTLQGSNLASQILSLPQFPPADFIGLSLVEVNQKGADIEIVLSIERGYKIIASSSEAEIIVKAAPLA